MVRFFVLGWFEESSLGGPFTFGTLGSTTIPTLWEVPLPLIVSSILSILSNTRSEGMPGMMFEGSKPSSLFARHTAVSNSSHWVFEIECPNRLSSFMTLTLPVRVLTVTASSICFAGFYFPG